jgi:protein-tyrosine kinase
MENIRQAVERAKSAPISDSERLGRHAHIHAQLPPGFAEAAGYRQIELDVGYLESRRIIGHDKSDRRSRAFDMLRTQVLQSMEVKDWRLLGITSPTAGCGKTLTAVNLAFSIARLPERRVLLVDMDLQKPQVAKTLGLTCEEGLVSLLDGESTLASALCQVRVGEIGFTVLPAEASISGSSERMASSQMAGVMQEIRRTYQSTVVIVDLPPLLSGDDVLTVLPHIDCALLVAAVGTSTVSEIKQCNKHLQSTDVIRLVLNKVQEASTKYYY